MILSYFRLYVSIRYIENDLWNVAITHMIVMGSVYLWYTISIVNKEFSLEFPPLSKLYPEDIPRQVLGTWCWTRKILSVHVCIQLRFTDQFSYSAHRRGKWNRTVDFWFMKKGESTNAFESDSMFGPSQTSVNVGIVEVAPSNDKQNWCAHVPKYVIQASVRIV